MAERKYFAIAEAAEMLQIDKQTLKKYIPELKAGKHYQDRRLAGGRKAKYFFNVEAIVEYWNSNSASRKP